MKYKTISDNKIYSEEHVNDMKDGYTWNKKKIQELLDNKVSIEIDYAHIIMLARTNQDIQRFLSSLTVF
jgi:hypothetical protein